MIQEIVVFIYTYDLANISPLVALNNSRCRASKEVI